MCYCTSGNLDGARFDRDSGSGPPGHPGRLLCMGLFSIFWRYSKMPQTIHTGIKALIDEANAQIETLSAAQVIKAAQRDDVVIVDIRDPREIERDGRIPGA